MKNILGKEEDLKLYDVNGNLVYEYDKNSNGYSGEYTYGIHGRVLTCKNSEGYSYEYTRDSDGRELTYKNSNGVKRGFKEMTKEEAFNKFNIIIK